VCLRAVSKEKEVAKSHRHWQSFVTFFCAVAFSATLAILPYALTSSREKTGAEEHVGNFVGTGFLLIAAVAGLMILEAVILRQLSSGTSFSAMATLFLTALGGYFGTTILTILTNPDYDFSLGNEVFFFVILYLPALIVSAITYFAVPRTRHH
jgi:hypothetical protein